MNSHAPKCLWSSFQYVRRAENSLETRPYLRRLYCSVLHYRSLKQTKKIGGRSMFFLYHLVLIIIIYCLCFTLFDSICLEQIVQFLNVHHTENIRLPYLKYQERDDIYVAQNEEKKYWCYHQKLSNTWNMYGTGITFKKIPF